MNAETCERYQISLFVVSVNNAKEHTKPEALVRTGSEKLARILFSDFAPLFAGRFRVGPKICVLGIMCLIVPPVIHLFMCSLEAGCCLMTRHSTGSQAMQIEKRDRKGGHCSEAVCLVQSPN